MALNKQHEQFCQGIFEGMSQRQAYLSAFPQAKKWKSETVDSKACVLVKSGKIKERLAEIREENASVALLSRENLLEKLRSVIDTKGVKFKGSDIIKAIEAYAKMCGYEVTPAINPETLENFINMFKSVEVVASNYIKEVDTNADKQ